MTDALNVCFVGLDNYPVLDPAYAHLYFGGESVQQSLLARTLAEQGHNVSMLVKDHGQPRDHKFAGIRCLSTFADGEGLPGLRFVYPKIYRVWQALTKADADIYYQSCADMLTGVTAAFCKARQKQFIYRVACDYDVVPEQLNIRFTRDKLIYFWGLRNADRILTQTQYQNEKLEENFSRRGHLMRMIVEAPAGSVDERVDVLWVNNIRAQKRADRIYAVAKALPQLRFCIIGGPVPGDETDYDGIKTALESLPNVSFKGMLPYAETAKYYNACRVFFSTSDIEGFPNAFLQAWAAGKPIVSSFDPDDLIKQHGLGIAVNEPSEFPQAIASLFADARRYDDYAANARRYIHAYHSEQAITHALLEHIMAL